MKTRKLIIGLVALSMLLAMSGIADAWFKTQADSTVTGKTGYVKITTCDVKLTDKFQPGDTQMGLIKVHNDGNCPVKIVRIEILGKPWFLAVRVEGPLNREFRPCQTLTFRMYVKMPQGHEDPQNKFFTYKVRFYALNTPTRWATPPQP